MFVGTSSFKGYRPFSRRLNDIWCTWPQSQIWTTHLANKALFPICGGGRNWGFEQKCVKLKSCSHVQVCMLRMFRIETSMLCVTHIGWSGLSTFVGGSWLFFSHFPLQQFWMLDLVIFFLTSRCNNSGCWTWSFFSHSPLQQFWLSINLAMFRSSVSTQQVLHTDHACKDHWLWKLYTYDPGKNMDFFSHLPLQQFWVILALSTFVGGS